MTLSVSPVANVSELMGRRMTSVAAIQLRTAGWDSAIDISDRTAKGAPGSAAVGVTVRWMVSLLATPTAPLLGSYGVTLTVMSSPPNGDA